MSRPTSGAWPSASPPAAVTTHLTTRFRPTTHDPRPSPREPHHAPTLPPQALGLAPSSFVLPSNIIDFVGSDHADEDDPSEATAAVLAVDWDLNPFAEYESVGAPSPLLNGSRVTSLTIGHGEVANLTAPITITLPLPVGWQGDDPADWPFNDPLASSVEALSTEAGSVEPIGATRRRLGGEVDEAEGVGWGGSWGGNWSDGWSDG